MGLSNPSGHPSRSIPQVDPLSLARQIDLNDLDYMIGYLANTPSRRIVVDCKALQLYLYVDVDHATHKDKKIEPQRWNNRLLQGIVALSSTEAELVGLSDLFDNLLYLESLF